MYLDPADLSTILYEELQEAITRGDDDIVMVHINEAMAFVQSKLSQKYDIAAEYQTRGKQRNNLLVKYLKDIAVYYCYDLPETMPTKRMKAYDDAVKFLDDAKNGNIVITGLLPAPTVVIDSKLGVTAWGSAKKRVNNMF
jgi:phage gp36-like protein